MPIHTASARRESTKRRKQGSTKRSMFTERGTSTRFPRRKGNISKRNGNVRMRSIPVVPMAKTGTRSNISRGEPTIIKPTVRIGGNSDKRGKAT